MIPAKRRSLSMTAQCCLALLMLDIQVPVLLPTPVEESFLRGAYPHIQPGNPRTAGTFTHKKMVMCTSNACCHMNLQKLPLPCGYLLSQNGVLCVYHLDDKCL